LNHMWCALVDVTLPCANAVALMRWVAAQAQVAKLEWGRKFELKLVRSSNAAGGQASLSLVLSICV